MYISIHIRRRKSIQKLTGCADFLGGEGAGGCGCSRGAFVGSERRWWRRVGGAISASGFCAVFGVLRKGSVRLD